MHLRQHFTLAMFQLILQFLDLVLQRQLAHVGLFLEEPLTVGFILHEHLFLCLRLELQLNDFPCQMVDLIGHDRLILTMGLLHGRYLVTEKLHFLSEVVVVAVDVDVAHYFLPVNHLVTAFALKASILALVQ